MQNDNFGLLKGQLSQHQSGTFTFILLKNGFSIVKKALFSSYFSIFSLSRFFTSKYAIPRLFLYNYSCESWEFVSEGSTLSDGKLVKDANILR